MWGFIKSVGTAVWNGITGTVSGIWSLIKLVFHRAIGLVEFFLSLLGIRFEKKLKLSVVILLNENNKPVTSISEVRPVVELARGVFKRQANVRIVSATSDDQTMITYHPGYIAHVMNPKCDSGGYAEYFGAVGRWFRQHSARSLGGWFGYGAPATMWVVSDVQGNLGCWPTPFGDYGYVDPVALSGSMGELLTLAHELGHACDLPHTGNGSLMEHDSDPRTESLTRLQIAWLRSSPRVTYF